MQLDKRTICLSCGRITSVGNGFCGYCHSPLGNVLKPPETNGGILFGHTEDDKTFSIPLAQLGHIAFYGQTFLGKSHHAMSLVKQFNSLGLTVTAVDRAGTWSRLIPSLQGKTDYYDPAVNLQINPFDLGDPGLVEMLLKETIFNGIEYEYADISPQMNYVLNQCISVSRSIPDLLKRIALYRSEGPFPLRSLNATKTALFVRLEPYKTNPILAKVFYCEHSSIELSSLGSGRNVFVDLYSLHKLVAYKKEIMLAYNFLACAYLKNALSRLEKVDKQINQVFVLDEAQLLVPKIFKKVTSADTWATTDFAAELLKRGVVLVIITQFPTSIEDGISKNIHHSFIYRLQDADEIKRVASMFGYTQYEQVGFLGSVLSNLQQRWCVVRSPLWTNPFLIRSPDVKLEENPDLDAYMPSSSGDVEYERDVDVSLNVAIVSFLESLKTDPFMPAAERRERLGMGDDEYASVVHNLEQNGTIESVNVKQLTGRPLVLYQLKGSNPGIAHQYYLHWLSSQLSVAGINAMPDHNRDMIAHGLKTVAIEYETGASDVMQNINAGLDVADYVISTSVDDSVLTFIRSKVDGQLGKRVFVRKLWSVPMFVLDLQQGRVYTESKFI